MSRRLLARLGLSAAVLVATVLLLEVGFRILGATLGVDRENLERFQEFVHTNGLMYEARPHTVFVRRPRPEFANSLGFKDVEWSLEKEPGVPRILCLGASTTEGGNQEKRPGQFPFLLGEELERRTGRRFEVLNAGISGWTTAETLVAWFLLLQDYEPDLVVIHHAINDLWPRNRDGFRADYTHWRRPLRMPEYGAADRLLIGLSDAYAWLRMGDSHRLGINRLSTTPEPPVLPWERDGHLPAGSEAPFRRNIETIGISAEGRGASVLLLTMPSSPGHRPDPGSHWLPGLAEHNQILRDLAAEHGWMLADAEAWPDEDPQAAEMFLDIVHLSKEGNLAKARIVADELEARWEPLVQPASDH